MNAPATPVAIAAGLQDIVDTAVAAGNFATLANALKAADLVTTLKGEGPFTVFAPTDAAFKKLAPGTIEALLKDKAKLSGILNYHVVAGKLTAAVLPAGDMKTVQGTMMSVVKSPSGVTVNNASVTTADIEASNGVIHAIDTVMMPK